MRLDKIRELNSVNEIYEYVLRNSTSWESVNKNLKKAEWFDYSLLDNFRPYLCNKYINKNETESSLDFLFVSNAKAFKLIYTNDEDSENHIQQSRVVIYYLFTDYFEGIYDNEVYKNFGFRVNGDIEQFKKLFLKENVDMFCSHLLTKAKQEERKQLSNRIVKAVKDIDGNYKTVVEYENYNFVSYEASFNDENKQDIDSYLYEKGELEEQEIIEPFKSDNIYSFMSKNLHLLTDKQREFLQMYKNSHIDTLFKTHDYMSKELKYKYKKNIANRFENKLLMNSKYIKKTKKNYYILLKSDNSFLLSKIFECKDRKEQFVQFSRYLKRNDEIGRLINEIIIEQGCMEVFCEYFNEGFTKEVMRFIYGRRFEEILKRLDKGDDKDVSTENKTARNCI